MGKTPSGILERLYEDFEPSCRRNDEEQQVVFDIDLPGYKKSELLVQTHNGTLAIRGQRRMEDVRKWQLFCKVIKFEKDWKKDEIRSQISENGKLSIIIPKRQRQPIWRLVGNSFSRLNLKLKKSYSRSKEIDANSSFEVAVMALLLILITIVMAAFNFNM